LRDKREILGETWLASHNEVKAAKDKP
jgi:hypothetical protein